MSFIGTVSRRQAAWARKISGGGTHDRITQRRLGNNAADEQQKSPENF
jgi:hypothetical protein